MQVGGTERWQTANISHHVESRADPLYFILGWSKIHYSPVIFSRKTSVSAINKRCQGVSHSWRDKCNIPKPIRETSLGKQIIQLFPSCYSPKPTFPQKAAIKNKHSSFWLLNSISSKWDKIWTLNLLLQSWASFLIGTGKPTWQGTMQKHLETGLWCPSQGYIKNKEHGKREHTIKRLIKCHCTKKMTWAKNDPQLQMAPATALKA